MKADRPTNHMNETKRQRDPRPYLDRNQPVLDSRPCEKHERPEPDCPECRFRDEPPYRITP